MRLADSQIALLGDAASLIGRHGDLLSEFELETITGVAERLTRYRRDADVTQPEWDVIEPAIEAMARAAATGRRGR